MKKYENFLHALDNLQDIYLYEEPYSNVILTGMVGLFEVCFEQSWKAMKEILEDNGYDESKTGSPKQILKLAYQARMISDEELWLDALVSRNNVSHSYNQGIALDIVKKTKTQYVTLFEKLRDTISNNWI